MESFAKMFYGLQTLNIAADFFIIDVSGAPDYTFELLRYNNLRYAFLEDLILNVIAIK